MAFNLFGTVAMPLFQTPSLVRPTSWASSFALPLFPNHPQLCAVTRWWPLFCSASLCPFCSALLVLDLLLLPQFPHSSRHPPTASLTDCWLLAHRLSIRFATLGFSRTALLHCSCISQTLYHVYITNPYLWYFSKHYPLILPGLFSSLFPS